MAGTKKNDLKKSELFEYRSSWYIRYPELQDDGTTKKIKKGGYGSSDEALIALTEKKEEYERQKAAQYKEDKDLTLVKYLTNWYEEIWSKQVRPNTEDVFSYTLYDYILPHLDKELLLTKATRLDIEALFDAIKEADHPSYAKKAKELLSICLNVAVTDKLIANNHCSRAKVPSYTKKEVVLLRKHQFAAFTKEASQTSTYLEMLLALVMGLRKGEIYGLKISDVDFAAKKLHIQRQVYYVHQGTGKALPNGKERKISIVTEAPLKTASSERVLPIPDEVMLEIRRRIQHIEELKRIHGDHYEDNGYLCGQKLGKARAGSCLNSALNKITDRLGYRRMAFHYLRHTTATLLFENGFDIHDVQAILGHSSPRTTKQVYIDIMDSLDQIAPTIDEDFGHLATVMERSGEIGN